MPPHVGRGALVKRFGTIGCFNRTKMSQRPRSAASTETLARPSGCKPERD